MRRTSVRKLIGGSQLANIKSQIKRNRQNDKRRLRNRVYRGQTRNVVRDARTAIESGDEEVSRKSLLQAISALDKAAEKGVLHKNNAARRKSRLMKMFNRMEPVARTEPAQVEPAVEVKESKAAGRKRAAKVEPKAETRKVEAKKPAEKKTETKKPAEKKPSAKKPFAKKPAEKKAAKPQKKTTAKK